MHYFHRPVKKFRSLFIETTHRRVKWTVNYGLFWIIFFVFKILIWFFEEILKFFWTFPKLIFFRVQVMLCKNKVIVGHQSLTHIYLTFAFSESFLLDLLKPIKIIFLNCLCFFLSKNQVGKIWTIYIYKLFTILSRL